MKTNLELMIDIGNTHTVIGLFQYDKLIYHWRMSGFAARTEDETWVILRSFFKDVNYEITQIQGACISSVVPDFTLTFNRMLKKYLDITPLHISQDLDLNMKILYEDPKAVGADRICNAVAGKKKYGFPLIILDFGTATTFDCINSDGNYLGGVICPGIESAASVLHHKAAKLPKIELNFPLSVIGRNTEESMQSGIMYGFVELINGLLDKIIDELGGKPKVIATGGLASVILEKTDRIDKIDDNLNLEGIFYIFKENTVTKDV